MTAQKIVECVPNFSEGRDRGVIDAIAASISAVAGVTLLDVDPGAIPVPIHAWVPLMCVLSFRYPGLRWKSAWQ